MACTAIALVFGAGGRVAGAQSIDGATAAARDALIRRAQDAGREGDHARAVDLARRAAALHSTVSLRRFLARELEATGDFAGALGAATQCVREAGSSDNVHDREHAVVCAAQARSLEVRVARIVVRVPQPAPVGTAVTIGDAPVPPVLWGQPYFVNPGTITVRATGDGVTPFEERIDVAAGNMTSVSVNWQRVTGSPGEPVAVGVPAARATAPPPATTTSMLASAPVQPRPRNEARVWGIAFVSLGGAAVLAGAGVEIAAYLGGTAAVHDDCAMDPAGNVWGPSGANCAARWTGYQTTNAAGIVTLAVGGAVLVTGIVLAALPTGQTRSGDASAFACGPSTAGVLCAGGF